MVRNLIIQIFLGEAENINDHPKFLINRDRWKVYCSRLGLDYMFFDKDNIEPYLGGLKDFYYGLRYTWQRIDFIRYLIINKEGGIYVDLDIYPKPNMDIFDILEQPYILNYWINKKGKKEINNAMMGFEAGSLNELILYSQEETARCTKMPIYDCWKVRYMLNTTGVRMFKRWCKKEKLEYTDNLHDYVTDEMTCTWLNNFH